MKMTKNNIVKIGGKTFEKCGNEYLRIHDEKYCGKKLFMVDVEYAEN